MSSCGNKTACSQHSQDKQQYSCDNANLLHVADYQQIVLCNVLHLAKRNVRNLLAYFHKHHHDNEHHFCIRHFVFEIFQSAAVEICKVVIQLHQTPFLVSSWKSVKI